MGTPVKLRQLVLLAVRGAGVVFCVLALLPAATFVESVLGAVYGERLGDYFLYGGGVQLLASMLVNAGIGAALCVWSGRLTAWLVPSLSSRCLRCGHRLDAANGGVCPECGGV